MECHLLAIFLLFTLQHHHSGAAPATIDLESTNEESSSAVADSLRRIQRAVTTGIQDFIKQHASGTDLPLALSLWQQNFTDRETACAAANYIIATVNVPSSLSCPPKYSCDYNPARWPSTLIAARCSYTPCRESAYLSPAMETCWGRENALPVAIFKQDSSEDYQHDESLGAAENGVEVGRAPEKDEVAGEWFSDYSAVVMACSCSAK